MSIECSNFQLFVGNRDQDIDFFIRTFITLFLSSLFNDGARFKLGTMLTYGVNSRSMPKFL